MKVLVVILSEFSHDDSAESRVVYEAIDLHLVDQVLDLRLRWVQAKLLHRDGQILRTYKRKQRITYKGNSSLQKAN